MTFVTRKALPRRAFVRGLGAAMALPLLDAMTPAFAGVDKPAPRIPVRLGFVYVPNGVIMEHWIPSTEGKGFVFNRTMQPLEPFRERLTVFSGLAQMNGRPLGDGAGDHARAGATWLTGVHPKKTEGFGIHAGISADQIAARQFSSETQLASLELGLESVGLAGNCDTGYSCAYSNSICWSTPTTPLPMEPDPRAVFERLFGDGDSTDAASRLAEENEDRSLLDFVHDDVTRLEAGLGPRDKSKLDQYLDGIRDVERRILKAEKQNADLALPTLQRPGGIPDSWAEHARLMMDLQAIALQADLTRVVTFMLGREGSTQTYREIGVPDAHHPITHHQHDPVKIEKVTKINAYHVETFAYLLNKLQSIPESGGSLLDHSLLLYGSSLSDGNLHTHRDLPLVLVGGRAGRAGGGMHLRYPPATPMTNLLLSLLDQAGVRVGYLGDSSGELRGLAEI